MGTVVGRGTVINSNKIIVEKESLKIKESEVIFVKKDNDFLKIFLKKGSIKREFLDDSLFKERELFLRDLKIEEKDLENSLITKYINNFYDNKIKEFLLCNDEKLLKLRLLFQEKLGLILSTNEEKHKKFEDQLNIINKEIMFTNKKYKDLKKFFVLLGILTSIFILVDLIFVR